MIKRKVLPEELHRRKFAKRLRIMEMLFAGVPPKDIVWKLNVLPSEVSMTKDDFPLFTGLKRFKGD